MFDEHSNSPQDSVPKFLKEPKYSSVLRENNFDHAVAASHQHSVTASIATHSSAASTATTMPERTLSRSERDSREHEELREPRAT